MFIRFKNTLIRRREITGVVGIEFANGKTGVRIHVESSGTESDMYFDFEDITVDEVERKLTLFPRLRRALRRFNKV